MYTCVYAINWTNFFTSFMQKINNFILNYVRIFSNIFKLLTNYLFDKDKKR